MGDLNVQLREAHEAIDVLRSENAVMSAAIRDTLRFHDDCICRHARKFLTDADPHQVPKPHAPGTLTPTGASPRWTLMGADVMELVEAFGQLTQERAAAVMDAWRGETKPRRPEPQGRDRG